MLWAPFFHIYQPPGQMEDILERVVNESYRPLVKILQANPRAKITLNINGSLTEQLYERGYKDLLDGLKSLATAGQIEFTESAKYHAFLPLLPWQEIVRQIKINHEANRQYLGSAYHPIGFFPPEMGYSRQLAEILASLGYQWVVVDEIAFSGKNEAAPNDKLFTIKDLPAMKVFFRERRLSNLIMGAVVRSAASLKEALRGETRANRFFITGMDGETFGHHRPGLEKLLEGIFASPTFHFLTLSELASAEYPLEVVDPLASTWSATEQDMAGHRQFMSWDDPENQIHALQWEFAKLVMSLLEKADSQAPWFPGVREKTDQALASDQFWWASAKPWWSLEMIENGAWRFLDIVRSLPGLSENILKRAEELYERIVLMAFSWQRTGYVRKLSQAQRAWIKVPFQERAGPGEYQATLVAMEREMKKAANHQEYEKAILWRDAKTKLQQGTDIYDAVHVVDQLRAQVSHQEFEKLIEKYRADYQNIRGGQPEQRG